MVDALGEVIEWHRKHLVPLGAELTSDARCRLVQGDFFALAAGPGLDPEEPGRRFHAVLLDVDHSPGFVLHPRHAALYRPDGLRRLAGHLHPGGVFALWSNEPPDDAFTARLRDAFGDADARAHVVSFDNPLQGGTSTNTVYVARAARLSQGRRRVRREPRVQVRVPERVAPPGREHRPPQRPLVREPGTARDRARRLAAVRVPEFDPVQVQGGEGPAGDEVQRAGGDRAAARGGQDPVADAAAPRLRLDAVQPDVAERGVAALLAHAEGHRVAPRPHLGPLPDVPFGARPVAERPVRRVPAPELGVGPPGRDGVQVAGVVRAPRPHPRPVQRSGRGRVRRVRDGCGGCGGGRGALIGPFNPRGPVRSTGFGPATGCRWAYGRRVRVRGRVRGRGPVRVRGRRAVRPGS